MFSLLQSFVALAAKLPSFLKNSFSVFVISSEAEAFGSEGDELLELFITFVLFASFSPFFSSVFTNFLEFNFLYISTPPSLS